MADDREKLTVVGGSRAYIPIGLSDASQAAVSGSAGGTYTATEQQIINDLVTLVNQLRSDLVTMGLIEGS